jgi:hypothetical protein
MLRNIIDELNLNCEYISIKTLILQEASNWLGSCRGQVAIILVAVKLSDA